jgi:hypothetical protein
MVPVLEDEDESKHWAEDRHLSYKVVAKPVVRQENKAAAAAASDRRELAMVALALAVLAITHL